MTRKIILFLASIFTIILVYSLLSNYKEPMDVISSENSFETDEKRYFQARIQGDVPSNPQADKFLDYNNVDSQLEVTKLNEVSLSDGNYAPVDNAVESCKRITSCDELDNTSCGYCFFNDKFLYGDKDGPKTDVCPGGWVKTKEDCLKRRERAICDKITSCHEMVGKASICAWCPTKNKAFVYKKVNGKIVPKYPTDVCNDPDVITGEDLGMVLNEDCDKFAGQHPCIGPNEDSGPHSNICLNKLWKSAGCSDKGTAAPQNNATSSKFWNSSGWKNTFADMKLWHADAVSNDWQLAKTHVKGCLGTDPNPCDPKYGGTTECYQGKFISLGCSKDGDGYPQSKPSMSIGDFENNTRQLIAKANNQNLSYQEKNTAYKSCYGGSLAAPPPIKVGDRVKYSVKVGGGNGAVCADSDEYSLLEFEGYVCKQNGTLNSVLWDKVTNSKPAPRCGNSPQIWTKAENNNIGWIAKYLGFCGVKPTFYGGNVQTQLETGILQLVHSCSSATETCSESGCSMQTITYVHYPSTNYSVAKDKVPDVLSTVRSVYSGAELANQTDIQYLVDTGIPYCACGWVNINGSLTSVYPSITGTDGGCGGGAVRVISCGNDGPSWAGGKAGVYILITGDPAKIPSALNAVKLSATVVSVVGKNEYNSLVGDFVPQSLPTLSPSNYVMYGPMIGPGGNNSIPIQKILIENNEYVFITQDEQFTKLIKTPASLQPQKGFYYTGTPSQYGNIPLINQGNAEYNVRAK